MILVTGSTGNLGRHTIHFLLQKTPANNIAALARDLTKAKVLKAKGIDIRIGDYHHYSTLVKAFSGVEKVLLISAAAFTDRIAQHINVINAAQEAGVKHVLYTSVQRKNDSSFLIPWITESDIETENYLKASGLIYTIIQNTMYAEALPLYLGETFRKNGIIFPAGNGTIPLATSEDIAEAIANIITEKGHENKEYTLTGDTCYSLHEIAEIVSELSGETIKYSDVSTDRFIFDKINAGVSPTAASYYADWAQAIKHGLFDRPTDSLQNILGRKPTSLKKYLQLTYYSNN